MRIAKWDDLREQHAPDLPAVARAARPGWRGPRRGRLDALLGRLSLARATAGVRAVARARGPLPTRGSALAAQLERLPVDGVLAHGVDDPDAVIRYLDDLRKRRVMLDGDALQRELGVAPRRPSGRSWPSSAAASWTTRSPGRRGAPQQELAAARRLLGFLRA